MKRYWVLGSGAFLVLLAIAVFASRFYAEPVYQGRPISQWIDQLTGAVGGFQGSVSSPALPKLIQQDPGPEIIPYLRATLHRGISLPYRAYEKYYVKLPASLAARVPRPNPTRNAELRYRAALILYYMGPKAKAAVPDLTEALHDRHAEVRRVAASTLGNMGTDAKSAEPALLAALIDPVAGVRRAALKALGSVESHPATLVPALAQKLKDPDAGVRTDAAQALRDFGPKATTAVRALIGALQDTNADVFRFATLALGKIGPEAKAAIPALRQALHENRPYTETTIRWAIQQIDTKTPIAGPRP